MKPIPNGMKRFIELADRVISYEVDPDTPGRCRRRCTIVVESGPELTEEEATAIIADLVARGVDVFGWEALGDE